MPGGCFGVCEWGDGAGSLGTGDTAPPCPCQVWASSFLPNEARLEERTQRQYRHRHGVPMLLEYAEQEARRKVRRWLSSRCPLLWDVPVPGWLPGAPCPAGAAGGGEQGLAGGGALLGHLALPDPAAAPPARPPPAGPA